MTDSPYKLANGSLNGSWKVTVGAMDMRYVPSNHREDLVVRLAPGPPFGPNNWRLSDLDVLTRPVAYFDTVSPSEDLNVGDSFQVWPPFPVGKYYLFIETTDGELIDSVELR